MRIDLAWGLPLMGWLRVFSPCLGLEQLPQAFPFPRANQNLMSVGDLIRFALSLRRSP